MTSLSHCLLDSTTPTQYTEKVQILSCESLALQDDFDCITILMAELELSMALIPLQVLDTNHSNTTLRKIGFIINS